MRPAWPVPCLLLLLAPAAAGCLDLGGAPPPAACGARLACTVLASPVIDVRVDHPFGSVHANGSALVVPVLDGGQEVGAVLLGTTLSWRSDEVFQAKAMDGQRVDEFVVMPPGEWAKVKQQFPMAPADDAALAAHGYAKASAALQRAASLVPANGSIALEGRWVWNGTFAATFEPQNVSMAWNDGPFVFNRTATSMIVVDNRTVVSWSWPNGTLDSQQDGLIELKVLDADYATDPARYVGNHMLVSFGPRRVDATILTPPFRKADLKASSDEAAHLASATLPGVAQVVIVKSTKPAIIEDGVVAFATDNMTVGMHPP